jgi:Spy/CpxP family protein refolding chaperone
MKKLSSVVTGVVAGVALAVAAVTYAQPFGGMGPGFGPGMGMGMGMGPGHGPMAGVDPAAIADSRLSDMKTLLKITPAQETAWAAFAATAKQQAVSMQAARAQMWDSAGTAPDRMAARTQVMQQRAAGMATMTTALNALYAVLTPEQKAIADQNFGMAGHRGLGFARRAS